MSKTSAYESRSRSLPQKVFDAGMIVLLLGIVISVGILSGIMGMRFAIGRTEVPVPRLTLQTVQEAKLALEAVDLRLAVLGERYEESTPKGAIISQFPRAGGRLKAKREVQVLVSLGKRTSPVPPLVGSNIRVAQLTAAEYNYEIGHISEVSLGKRKDGVVVQQFPPPGSTTAVSPRVNLLVSRERAGRYVMPDLLGQNLNEVKPFLEREGFKLASIQYGFYRNADRGVVVKQFPEPGYMLTNEDPINLEVAR